jgi:hypothetical protein
MQFHEEKRRISNHVRDAWNLAGWGDDGLTSNFSEAFCFQASNLALHFHPDQPFLSDAFDSHSYK